jgi:hypothetical protein
MRHAPRATCHATSDSRQSTCNAHHPTRTQCMDGEGIVGEEGLMKCRYEEGDGRWEPATLPEPDRRVGRRSGKPYWRTTTSNLCTNQMNPPRVSCCCYKQQTCGRFEGRTLVSKEGPDLVTGLTWPGTPTTNLTAGGKQGNLLVYAGRANYKVLVPPLSLATRG